MDDALSDDESLRPVGNNRMCAQVLHVADDAPSGGEWTLGVFTLSFASPGSKASKGQRTIRQQSWHRAHGYGGCETRLQGSTLS